ncbi:MAG: PSD1 and planctomycete cytochrome C domain-containing protein [Pirellulaceae bacterium]|nr:PSD1 and planctomycete cytochrome C domain-containing protein [Pirellulaceae bacterium]
MRFCPRLAIGCAIWLLAADWLLAAQPLTFERDVRPILKAHCFDCHGDQEKHEGNLDLRLVRLIGQGGDSGPALVAGKATESLLVQRIAAGEMPPEGKHLPAKDLATLKAWIDQGAKTARPEPQALADITDDDRAFWSFQPIQSPPVPTIDNPRSEINNPLDPFLLAELAKVDLGFSPRADKRTLIRRVTFDLVGLPPTPDEVEAFLADESPDAWERLLDRLLARPQYGERWGRHWLDVAGYADSDGYSEKDLERKYAYKYRDYVIRAFNADKPWDVFLREQLAGDELIGSPPYKNLSPVDAERLTATGFLRMAPDGSGAVAPGEQDLARNEVVADTIKVVSSSLLGLTVGCAQCHNHRYDPIPQADYYRIRALFEPAYNWKAWRAPGGRLISLWTDEQIEAAKQVDAELKALADEKKTALDAIVEEIFASEVAKLPEDQQELARTARAADAKARTPEQQQILKDHPSLNVNPGSAYLYSRKRMDEFNQAYAERQVAIQDRRPAEDFVPCLTEVPGQLPPTFVFFRGDITQPKQEVQPGELTVLATAAAAIPTDDPALKTSGRRLVYAKWLTSGQHPLVGRVLVNRFWLHHFGRGIVATPGDFGFLGARPTHPQLLDWLATRFVADGWELKRFHRLLLGSAAYRQSSRRTDAIDRVDPENRLLGRMSIRRLEAEAVRDSLLAASGRLNHKLYGAPTPVTPDEVGQVILGVDTRDGAGRFTGKKVALGEDEFRRSLYVQVRRSLPLSMLETFDAPLLTPNCDLRSRSTVAPQSLLLMNNDFVIGQSNLLAQRILAEAGEDPATRVRLAWKLALAAEPADWQMHSAITFLTAQEAEFVAAAPKVEPNPQLPMPAIRALAALCQALFSSNAFLYVD